MICKRCDSCYQEEAQFCPKCGLDIKPVYCRCLGDRFGQCVAGQGQAQATLCCSRALELVDEAMIHCAYLR